MTIHAEPAALAQLRTEVALLNLPVLLDDTGDDVCVHLQAVISDRDEAHLMRVVSKRVREYHLDKIQGPELPPEMHAARIAAWVATHHDSRTVAS
jgi:hypothetical protein